MFYLVKLLCFVSPWICPQWVHELTPCASRIYDCTLCESLKLHTLQFQIKLWAGRWRCANSFSWRRSDLRGRTKHLLYRSFGLNWFLNDSQQLLQLMFDFAHQFWFIYFYLFLVKTQTSWVQMTVTAGTKNKFSLETGRLEVPRLGLWKELFWDLISKGPHIWAGLVPMSSPLKSRTSHTHTQTDGPMPAHILKKRNLHQQALITFRGRDFHSRMLN